eukprot:1427187-Pleurochrysis_carterae.AAC.3
MSPYLSITERRAFKLTSLRCVAAGNAAEQIVAVLLMLCSAVCWTVVIATFCGVIASAFHRPGGSVRGEEVGTARSGTV